MGEPVSPEESHERQSPRSQPFVKRQQRGFPRKNIADQHGDKIDEIVLSHPRARTKRTRSWMVVSRPVCVSTCANAATSPIQEGMEGLDAGVI